METEHTDNNQTREPDEKGAPALIDAPQKGKFLQPPAPTDSETRKDQTVCKLREYAVSISQYGLLLCNLAALVILWFQLQQYIRQTAIFQSQLISGQRAWVTLKQADHTEIKEGKGVGIKLVFTNSGNSPALNLTINSNAQFRSIPVPSPMPLADECASQERSRGVVTPHGDFLNIKTLDEILTKEQTSDINNRNRRLYAWGRIEYDDIFGERHQTEYCLFSQPGTLNFTGCENNNTAN